MPPESEDNDSMAEYGEGEAGKRFWFYSTKGYPIRGKAWHNIMICQLLAIITIEFAWLSFCFVCVFLFIFKTL